MQNRKLKKMAISALLVLALLIPTIPLPVRAELSADVAAAYLDVLLDDRTSIPVEPWMALRGADPGSTDKKEKLKSVALTDLDADGVPELIFLTTKDNEGIFGQHVFLNIFSYTGGEAKQLSATEISYGGGTQPHFFKVYRIEGSGDLFAHGGSSHALSGGGSYFSFSLKDGTVSYQRLDRFEKYDPMSSGVTYTYKLNGNMISEAEHQRLAEGMSGPITEVLMDSGSENSGQSGLIYGDAVALLSTTIAQASIRVMVNGAAVQWTDARPFIDENNRTLVPLRAVAEALSLTVAWDPVKREASFTDTAKTIIFPVGSSTAYTSDGGTLQMDTAAVIVNDRTYAPVRYLAEYFGYTVGWDATTRTALIQKAAVLNSANVVWTRMNHSYWMEWEGDASSRPFVNCYYDLAAITDGTPLKEKINASLRSGYEVFRQGPSVGQPYSGGYDEGSTNFSNGRPGEIVQNADGILSLRYFTDWMMGGVGDGSPSGVTVSLRTGERLYLSDLITVDGSAITFQAMEDCALSYFRDLGVEMDMISFMLPYFREKSLDDLAFYIEDNQIILCIAKYELAPGAAGSAAIPTGLYIKT